VKAQRARELDSDKIGAAHALQRVLSSCLRLLLQVCRVAQGALRSDRKEQKLQETTERRRAGDKLAVPDPLYLIGRRWAYDSQSWRVPVQRSIVCVYGVPAQ
jgi:hypothetical protein